MRRWLLALLLLIYALPAVAQRTRYNFNPDWLLWVGDAPEAAQPAYDDTRWKQVVLPRAWNEDYAFRVSIHDQPTGIAWYRKHFKVPTVQPGQRVLIEFEGARLAAEVYINGKSIGLSESGVAAFGFDLTPYLVPGDNVLAVRTDNRWDYREKATNSKVQWNNGNFYSNFGGLNKNVWLYITPAVHQTLPLFSSMGSTGQYVWADGFNLGKGAATVHAESQARNDTDKVADARLSTDLIDLNGRVVASANSSSIQIAPHAMETLTTQMPSHGLHFWSWGYGYLYTVRFTLRVDGQSDDTVLVHTGFRQTAFHDGMIYLNGRVMQVHGYAARTTNEWPALGTDVPPWVSDFSNGLIVKDNGNLVRWMHVTPSKQDVESCDRVGLPQSMPAGDAEGDPKGREWQARVELMRDSIIYNRNNPSILFYESGNKGITEEHMRAMLAVRNQFDPHGGRAIGSREMLNSKLAEYGGEMLYINKSSTKPVWAHEYNRDEGARKFWDDQTPPFHKDSPLYNRNQDSYTLEDVVRWDDYFRARPGTGSRVSSGGVNISWIDENSHFRGDNNYRRSGEVDSMRIPKDAFFAHQVIWDGWVDPEHPRVHISGHWNYHEGITRTVNVIANTAFVELKLNGHSLGIQSPSNDFVFAFKNVVYKPGRLEAIALDKDHRPLASTRLETTGQPVRIVLTPHVSPTGFHADGSDLALVDVEVVDAKNRRVPVALNMIHFQLDGPAEWRGGIAQGSAIPVPINSLPMNTGLAATAAAPYLHEDNYILSKDLPVEGGINRVSIRSTEQAGTITLIAKSDNLQDARITLTSTAVAKKDGLSNFDPSDKLASNLERGPTPSTPSFKVTRQSVVIKSATAGANSSEAVNSFDGDETTSWSNGQSAASDITSDGLPVKGAKPYRTKVAASLDAAWVEYTLDHPVSPTALDLKLVSFRLRRYPVQVTLDGKTVYKGTTPTSLGYVTLPLQTVAPGTHLRIQLTAPSFAVEESHALVEVNGKIDQAQPESQSVSPLFGVIEAEVYTAPGRDSTH